MRYTDWIIRYSYIMSYTLLQGGEGKVIFPTPFFQYGHQVGLIPYKKRFPTKIILPLRRSAREEGSGERSFEMVATSASRIVCSRLPFSEKERKENRVLACNCLFSFLFGRSHLLRAWNRLSVEGEKVVRANIVCSTFIQFVCSSQSAIQLFWCVSETNVKHEGWNTPDALFIALKWRNHPRPRIFIYLNSF